MLAVLDGERVQLPPPDELPPVLVDPALAADIPGAAGEYRRRGVRRGASAELLDELCEFDLFTCIINFHHS